MDKNNLIFNFNLKFNYNAAFLFYNLKGIIAEKWGHNYFNRFADSIGSLQLENREEKKACLYGLKNTDIYFQELQYDNLDKNTDEIKELSQDIIKAINISKISNIESTTITIYKPKKPNKIFEKIKDNFIKINPDFFPITSIFYDLGIILNFEINRFKHSISFGPLTEENIPRFFRYKFDFIKDSLIFVFTSKLDGKSLDINIDKQKENLSKIIDINLEYSNNQIRKILKILDIE